MPCDKFMEKSLEDRLDWNFSSVTCEKENIAYQICVNPETGYVQYPFPGNSIWVNAD